MRFDEIETGCKPLEDIERAIGPMAWGLTLEDLTPHGLARLYARGLTPRDILLAVLVAALHVRRAS